MKRILTIFLLLIFLFNLVGYKAVISYMEFKADVRLQAQIDNNLIHDDQLVSVKTALNNPYYNYPETFESASGTIEVNGVEYNYVKRRVVRDTLEVLCYPNLSKKTLKDAGKELAKFSTENPNDGKSKKSSSYKFAFSDLFENVLTAQVFKSFTYSNPLGLYQQPNLSQQFLMVEGQPPEVGAA